MLVNRPLKKIAFARQVIAAALVCSSAAAAATGERAAGPSVEAAPTARIHVTLSSPPGVPLAGEGFVVFRGTASGTLVVLPTKLPGSAATELPLGSQWTLITDFPGYFAANSIFQVPAELVSSPLETSIVLRPAGTLTGKFLVGERENFPAGLEARFEPTREGPPKKQDVPPGLATCAVSKEWDWRCRVPAGQLDIAFHPKGFVPHYLWNVAVPAGETSALGSSKLVRGASVAGWVTKEDGTPSEKCRVRLEPASAPGPPSDPALEFLRSVASEAPCQKKGFFQFSAVAAGAYALVAEEGDAQARISPVEVWDGAESRISTPIALRRPVDFEVTLTPPVDWLGRPWRFEARRAIERRSGWEHPSVRAEASLDGRVKIPKQPPGRFWISVYDALGNTVFSDSHVELTESGQSYPIHLDLLFVEGKVQLGDEPVAGRLVFSGQSGAAAISMLADEEGHFEGPLPKAGDWIVEVQATEPPFRANAEVNVKPKGDRALVIDLPDTKVYGRVVDPAAAPVPGAIVSLSSALGSLQTVADKKGEFEFRAFPEDTLTLSAERSAEHGNREVSDSYLFEGSEAIPHGPVVLTLRRNQTLRGKVLGATGPVVGAGLGVWPVEGGNGAVSAVRSQIDGAFEVQVPEGTPAVTVVVSPPVGALKAYQVAVSQSELLLQVEPQGGELVLDLGKEEALEGRILAVWQGDIGIPIGTLIRWTEGHGARFMDRGRVRIPQLAPGYYTACLGAPAMIDPAAIEEWKKGRANCASGYLAGASTLDLRLP
jgi:hypothetical protein